MNPAPPLASLERVVEVKTEVSRIWQREKASLEAFLDAQHASINWHLGVHAKGGAG